MSKKLTYKTDVTVFGDYKKTQINVGPHMFKILIKMYKNPIASIVREITSNAIDATIEAGVDKPVVVSLTDEEFIVKDFGIGISPERAFNYFNFGYSSKLEDDEQIGAYGLGAKCVLAYQNSVIVETNYDGIKYKYSQFIDGDGIPSYRLINEGKTDEQNGTTIIVKLKERYDKKMFQEEMENLRYNKFVILMANGNVINKDDKIYEHDNFVIGNWEKEVNNRGYYTPNHIFIVRQSIKYPLDVYEINMQKLNEISHIPIGIKVGLEIPVTPSRDNIIYNKDTIEIIKDKVKKIHKYFIKKLQEQNNVTVDNWLDLIKEIYKPMTTIILHDKKYYFNSKLDVNRIVKVKNSNINLALLAKFYNEPFGYQLKHVYFSLDFKALGGYGGIRNIDDNYLFINIDKYKGSTVVNKNIYEFLRKNNYNKTIFFKTKQKEIKDNLLKQLEKYYKEDKDKVLKIVRKLEKEFFDAKILKYEDFKPNKKKEKKERTEIVIGNIYPLNIDSIKVKERLKDYYWNKKALYILGTNDYYWDLKKINKFVRRYKFNVIVAILPKTFIKDIPKDVQYIYLKSQPQKIEKYKIMKDIITMIEINEEKDSDTYYYIEDKLNIFFNNKIPKLIDKIISKGIVYYADNIKQTLKSHIKNYDNFIDYKCINLYKDFINFSNKYNQMSEGKKLQMFFEKYIKDEEYLKNTKLYKQSKLNFN